MYYSLSQFVVSEVMWIMPALFPEKVSFSLGYPLLGLIVSFPYLLLLEHWPAGNVDGQPFCCGSVSQRQEGGLSEASLCISHFSFNLDSRV